MNINGKEGIEISLFTHILDCANVCGIYFKECFNVYEQH